MHVEVAGVVEVAMQGLPNGLTRERRELIDRAFGRYGELLGALGGP